MQSFDPIVSSGQKVAASVVMESGSVDISQMKIEDFTSQRLQDEEEEAEKQMTSPDTSPVKIQGKTKFHLSPDARTNQPITYNLCLE